MTDEELAAATPACPQCLRRLDAAVTDEHPYWECPGCGYLAIGV